MHPDLVAAIFRQRMTTLVSEANARRLSRQIASGARPRTKRSAITRSVTQ
jgi:hypothetical protein